MATIQDIADEVGISKAAVSRILNHKGSFSKETVNAVERAAKRLNYSSYNMLKQETEKDNKVIGLIVPPSTSPFYGILVNMIESVAYKFGYSILLCGSAYYHMEEMLSLNR